MSILNPGIVFASGWIIVILFSYFFKNLLGEIKILTSLIVLLGALIFGGVAVIVEKIRLNPIKIKQYKFKPKYLLIYIWINIFINIVLFKKINSELLLNRYILGTLRYKINYEGFSFGLIGYLMLLMINFSIYLYVLYVYKKIKIKKIQMALVLFISIFYLICFTNRLNIILYGINLFVIYCMKNKFQIKKFLILASFSFYIFYWIGKLTKKMDNLKDIFISYFLLAYKYFDSIIINGYKLTYGEYTFQVVRKVLAKLGIIETHIRKSVISKENGYYILTEKLMTNVPTMYGRLISDFGIIYIYILICIFAIITTLIYKKAVKGSILNVYLYSYVVGYLFFTFYDEMFFRIVIYWGEVIMSGYFFEFIFTSRRRDE